MDKNVIKQFGSLSTKFQIRVYPKSVTWWLVKARAERFPILFEGVFDQMLKGQFMNQRIPESLKIGLNLHIWESDVWIYGEVFGLHILILILAIGSVLNWVEQCHPHIRVLVDWVEHFEELFANYCAVQVQSDHNFVIVTELFHSEEMGTRVMQNFLIDNNLFKFISKFRKIAVEVLKHNFPGFIQGVIINKDKLIVSIVLVLNGGKKFWQISTSCAIIAWKKNTYG